MLCLYGETLAGTIFWANEKVHEGYRTSFWTQHWIVGLQICNFQLKVFCRPKTKKYMKYEFQGVNSESKRVSLGSNPVGFCKCSMALSSLVGNQWFYPPYSTWSPCWNILKHFPLLISLLEVSHRGIVGFFLVWLVWRVFSGIQKRKCQASMIRSQQRRGCKGKQHKSRRKMEQKREQFLQLCRWNRLLSLNGLQRRSLKNSGP